MEIKIRKDYVTEISSLKEFMPIIKKHTDIRMLKMDLRFIIFDKHEDKSWDHPFVQQVHKMTYTELFKEAKKSATEFEIISSLLYYNYYPYYLLYNDEKYLLIRDADSVHSMNSVSTDNPNADYAIINIDARLISTVSNFKEYAEAYIQRNRYNKFTLEDLKDFASYYSFYTKKVPNEQINDLSYEERLKFLLKIDSDLEKEVKKYGQNFLEKHLIYISEYIPTNHFIILPTVEEKIYLLKTSRFSKKEYEIMGGKIKAMRVHPIRFKSVA